jgi:hypothetical protein
MNNTTNKPIKWFLETHIPEVLIILDHPDIRCATSASLIYGDDLEELQQVFDLEKVTFKRTTNET